MTLNKKVGLAGLVLLFVTLTPFASASKEPKVDTVEVSSKNLLVLNGVVTGDTAGAVTRAAKELDSKLWLKSTPLYLYLNTPGGEIQPGNEMLESLKGLGRPIHTIVAFAASMGFQIAENLDNRYILDKGIMMSHRAAGQFEGSFGGEAGSPFENRMHLWVQFTKEMDQEVVERSKGKQTIDSYQKAYNNELWMTGHESIQAGYSDSIIHVKCDKSLSGSTTHSAEFMGLTVNYDLDNCPVNSSPFNLRIANTANLPVEYINSVKNQFESNYKMREQTPVYTKQEKYGVSW